MLPPRARANPLQPLLSLEGGPVRKTGMMGATPCPQERKPML